MTNATADGRVAIVTGANLSEGAPGGTRTYVLGLLRFLSSHGVEVDLISNGPAEGIPPSCRVLMASSRFTPRTLVFQRRLWTWARHADLARVRLMHFQRPDDLQALHSLRKLPPIVCTLHGNPRLAISRRYGPLPSFGYRLIESRTLMRCRAIIAVDESTARAYRGWYPALAGRIGVIPVAVDDTMFHSETSPVPRTHPRSPVLLYVGRLSAEKRIPLIIDAVRKLSHVGAELIIAGSGPEEDTLRTRARGSRTTFLGNVDQVQLGGLYRTADALVLASDYEGLPTVALEALSVGCPVVAIAAPWSEGLRNLSHDVIVSDRRYLPEALGRALELRNNRDSIRLPQQFSWPVVGEQILNVYRRAGAEGLG